MRQYFFNGTVRNWQVIVPQLGTVLHPDPRNHHGAVTAAVGVGDMTIADLIAKAPLIFGGLGLAALGTKVNHASQRPKPQVHQDKMSICAPFMRGSWKLN